MRVIVTGHTKNLGLAIYNHMVNQGHEVQGFSRSNGYNIPEKLDEIAEYARTCDIFFNNVHHELTQAEFIKRLAGQVKIVTSGSMAAQFNRPANPYFVTKRKIQETHAEYKRQTNVPMLLLRMGYLENYPEKNPTSYAQILNVIDCWIQNPRMSIVEFENDPVVYSGFS